MRGPNLETGDTVIDSMVDSLNGVIESDGGERIAGATAVIVVAFAAYLLFRFIVVPLLRRRGVDPSTRWGVVFGDRQVLARLSFLVPVVVATAGLEAVPHLEPDASELIGRVLGLLFVVGAARLATAASAAIRDALNGGESPEQPRARLQAANLAIYAIAAIFAATVVTGQSLWYLITGLGAIAAILAIVFQDTILSTVASIQISQNDMVRVGDWIEAPHRGADGHVIDVALHGVKVQNFDNTIVTIPTYALVSESFTNWRGMSDSGVRRMKRSMSIDATSIRFAEEEEIDSFRTYPPLDEYVDRFRRSLPQTNNWNDQLSRAQRRLTNLGLFRAYVLSYVSQRALISSDNHLVVVRQLESGAAGMPLEIYAFVSTTRWPDFETVQSETFEHLLSILPAFGLRLYQPVGDAAIRDLRIAMQNTLGDGLRNN